MEGFVYSVGSMFRISKESEENVCALKRQIADALSTKESYLFNVQAILGVDLRQLIEHINNNTKATGIRASKTFIKPGTTYLMIQSNPIPPAGDGQKGKSKNEIYKILFG